MKPVTHYEGREQTYLKHLVLERYLERVAYNIASFRSEIVYVDPFSGPWKSGSHDHSDTSFMIAIETLRKVREGLTKPFGFRCFFVESENCENLQRAVAAVDDVQIETRRGTFEEHIGDIVSFVGRAFSFVFVDPTGWTGFGMQAIQPILKLRGEVLINFMFDYINRFFEHDDAYTTAQMDALFGGGDWHGEFERLLASGLLREEAIIELYKGRLKRAGAFEHVKSIRILKPDSDRAYFHLVFATRHAKGIIELASVEKAFFAEQEKVRAELKQEAIEAKAGPQLSFFARQTLAATSRSFNPDREKQLMRGRNAAYAFLAAGRRVKYEGLRSHLLEMSLIWESDVKDFIAELSDQGVVAIGGMTYKQRRVGEGCVIVFKPSSATT